MGLEWVRRPVERCLRALAVGYEGTTHDCGMFYRITSNLEYLSAISENVSYVGDCFGEAVDQAFPFLSLGLVDKA